MRGQTRKMIMKAGSQLKRLPVSLKLQQASVTPGRCANRLLGSLPRVSVFVGLR